MSGNKRSGTSGRKVHHSGDLIALGSKPTSSKSSSRHSIPDGEDSSKSAKPPSLAAAGIPSKKFKPAPPGDTGVLFSDPIKVSQVSQQSGVLAKQGSSVKGSQSHSPQPSVGIGTQQIIEVRSTELVSAIRTARAADNDVKAAKLLGGALKQLKLSRLKPDTTLNSALVTLVRELPAMFSAPAAIEGLVQVLKREPSIIFKAKSNPSVYVLAAQLLLFSLKDSYDWPELVAKVYIEDALGDRVWVDLDPCKELVANICTVFTTKPYSSGSSGSSGVGLGGGAKLMDTGKTSESGEGGGGGGADVTSFIKEASLSDIETSPRYSPVSRNAVKIYVVQAINDQLGRHNIPTDSVSRNLLRLFTAAVGLPELRLLVAQRVDSWIQNPKLGKLCQELLMTVAVNCHTHGPEDILVIEALINIRLKTKLFSSQFVVCIKELIGSHPANFVTVMRGVVSNELGQWRSPSNMALISMMVHSWPEESAKLLGTIFQEFLGRREDYLRALRGFLREVVRVVRNEFNYTAFVRALMQERSEPEFAQLEVANKERMIHGLADLICVIGMLTASVLIREAYNGYNKGDRAMISQLHEFFSTLGLIQRDAVWWVHTVVPGMFRPQPAEYKSYLRKILFLDTNDICNKDSWPPEADRSLILKMMGEACLNEDTLMRVLVIGLTRELPLSSADAMEIADILVARAASAHTDDIHRLPSIERKELFSAIFDISTYRPPANIQLPDTYHPPSLAISKLYWKGWLLLLVLSAFNTKTVAAMGWNDYPMLRGMMEMVMTSNYGFPMSTNLEVNEEGVAENKDSATVRELQLARSEKEAILEYENHLASSSGQKVTETSSYLLNQVTMLKPKGPARKIPPAVVDLIKTVNRTLSLGQLLCRCRSPDFLLNIIKRQGTSESMKWLTDLVESSNSSMEVLPVPCLCEFLMASYQDQLAGSLGGTTEAETDPNSHRSQYKRRRSAKDKAFGRHKQLIEQLQNLISGPKCTPQTCSEVLAYFLEKLTLSHITPRKLAMNALHDILARSTSILKRNSQPSDDTEDEEYSSALKDGERLVSCLPSVTHFVAILPQIYPFLLQACLVETNLNYLQHYLLFLTQNYPHDKLYESVVGLSHLIVDRFDIIQKILSPSSSRKPLGLQGSTNVMLLGSLFELFRSAMEVALHSQAVPQVSSSSDFLLVSFPSKSQKALIHTALTEAIFLMLSLGPPLGTASVDFAYLRDLWVPSQPLCRPEAHTMEGKEPVSLPPKEVLSWTLQSTNSAVLAAAIQIATPSQLSGHVQCFGCPVTCMERVLEVLDDMCSERNVASVLRHCVIDPVVMARHVEIQMLRGVKAGSKFLIFIRCLSNLPPIDVTTTGNKLTLDKKREIGVSDSLFPLCKPAAAARPFPHSKIKRMPQFLHEQSPEEIEKQLMQIICQCSDLHRSPSASQMRSLRFQLENDLRLCLRSEGADIDLTGLVTALLKVTSSKKMKVVEGMLQTRFAITLFRMMTQCLLVRQQEHLSDLFRKTIHVISKFLESSRCKRTKLKYYQSFIAVLKVCAGKLKAGTWTSHFSVENRMVKNIMNCPNPFQMEPAIISVCHEAILGRNLMQFESVVNFLVKRSISFSMESRCIKLLHDIKTAVSSTCTPLAYQSNPKLFTWKDDQNLDAIETEEVTAVDIQRGDHDISGLLVDVLEVLDSEIDHVCTSVSMKFLFGCSEMCKGPLKNRVSNLLMSGQGYLLACLVNNSSWSSILSTIGNILDKSNMKEWINPSAVLDFVWACLHKPCLWQERVKKEAIVNSSISLGIDEASKLRLTLLQLEAVLWYVLKEAALYYKDLQGQAKALPSSEEVTPEVTAVLKARLPLLICCLSDDDQHLQTVVHYLQTNTSFPSLSWQLLVLLYHATEKVIFLVDQPQPLTAAALDTFSSNRLDSVLHCLISAMADFRPGLTSSQKVCNASLQCCKLTLHHPAVMLRQLPMLGWMLNGRAHLKPGEFKNRNHKMVFENVFTLLELLQPLIFTDSQADALNLCLKAFFDFMKNHCSESKKYQDIVIRFSDFLVQYAHHNREKAVVVIFNNLDTLRSLSEVYSNKKSSLKHLVESFPRVPESFDTDSLLTMMMVPPLSVSQGLTHEQVLPFLKKLENGQQREDILKVLQDLKETSLHSVDILRHFVPELCRIIQESEPESVTLAHDLLIRHLKHSPRAVSELLPAFVGCLESPDYSVIKATLPHVQDLLLLCKGSDASYLLKKMFRLATHSFGCTSELAKCVEAFTQYTVKEP